jgi:hypothetical protein
LVVEEALEVQTDKLVTLEVREVGAELMVLLVQGVLVLQVKEITEEQHFQLVQVLILVAEGVAVLAQLVELVLREAQAVMAVLD